MTSAIYVKVARPFLDGVYMPLYRDSPEYKVGEITKARCPLNERHRPPMRWCQCGIYCTTPAGLRWVPYLLKSGQGEDHVLLAVRPVGRAYHDGHVVRAQKVLVLGEIEDWRALLPRRLRTLDPETVKELADCYTALRWGPWDKVLAVHRLWRLLGRPLEPWRCASIHQIYLRGKTSERSVTRRMLRAIAGECPYCAGEEEGE